ncbi:HNH endonuclease, partial [Salmonella enterica]|nr:HNH endonuclease [Salmonella enterica]EIY9227790.1 HNH endonuclease [Salmonella enterica]
KSGQRKLIVYIFDKLERIRRGTRELKMDIVSLEHISSQSKTNESVVGMIGNLLPLCFSLNEDCKNYELHKKIESYKKSDLKLVTEFVSESEAREHKWDDSLIKERTDSLALETFAKI